MGKSPLKTTQLSILLFNKNDHSLAPTKLVAGTGFEPMTFGL